MQSLVYILLLLGFKLNFLLRVQVGISAGLGFNVWVLLNSQRGFLVARKLVEALFTF